MPHTKYQELWVLESYKYSLGHSLSLVSSGVFSVFLIAKLAFLMLYVGRSEWLSTPYQRVSFRFGPLILRA